jgi:hypothetical protein
MPSSSYLAVFPFKLAPAPGVLGQTDAYRALINIPKQGAARTIPPLADGRIFGVGVMLSPMVQPLE